MPPRRKRKIVKPPVPCVLGHATNSTVTSFQGQRLMQYTACESCANKLLDYTFLCGDLPWSYCTSQMRSWFYTCDMPSLICKPWNLRTRRGNKERLFLSARG